MSFSMALCCFREFVLCFLAAIRSFDILFDLGGAGGCVCCFFCDEIIVLFF